MIEPAIEGSIGGGSTTQQCGALQTARSGTYRDVWERSVLRSPENLYSLPYNFDTFMRMSARIRSEDFVFIADTSGLQFFIARMRICDIVISRERFFKANVAFPAQKDFPFLKMFNDG